MAVRDVVQAAAGVGGGGEYVEDVFSTYLYTGTGSAITITNGIDLDGEGGMVWFKSRDVVRAHSIWDTARPATDELDPSQSWAATVGAAGITSYNSNGFTIGTHGNINRSNEDFVSWTWRKSPKFFDVVTWTGDDTIGRQIPHSLGSVPGCIMVKATSRTSNWAVYHRSIGNNSSLFLNNTDATTSPVVYWNSTNPTATEFTISDGGQVNENGETYVAYLFAHDAGGFGDDGEQNVVSCGSYTGTGAVGNEVTLGFEPQWVMIKSATASANWYLFDNMRGIHTGSNDNVLWADTNRAEFNSNRLAVSATGFTLTNAANTNTSGHTYIYIAIRRPMKTPESGTEVFAMDTQGSSSGKPNYKSGFPVDFAFVAETGSSGKLNSSRLTSPNVMYFNNTNAEASDTERKFDYQNGWGDSVDVDSTRYSWMFKRAPSFMDVVAYTGNGTAGRTVAHNLGVVPELMIVKCRSSAGRYWATYYGDPTKLLQLNDSVAAISALFHWDSTAPTESVFSVGAQGQVNASTLTYVAYLFATLDGVSKVGSYTGTGADLNVDCGFSAGARFILIKRTDSTGDWYVWDSVRGISAGNDPYLLLNSTAAQVTNTDYIDPLASGFTVTSSAPAALNASGGSYIFLAIA